MSQKLGSLPVGAKVKDAGTTFLGKPIVWQKADSNHAGYPENSTTLITEKCVALRPFDAKEPNNSDSNRKSYGNNKYSVSNIDQWLNSEAGAGAWYSAQHSQDQAPDSSSVVSCNTYSEDAGFMSGFSSIFKKNLLQTTLKVALNTKTDGGNYETIERKVFLASTTEVGLANENSIAEGEKLALFSDNTSRIGKVTQEGIDDSDYSSNPASPDTAWYWWLRTPYSSYSNRVRSVGSGGALGSDGAYGGYCGVRPLCNLSSDTLVSDTVDEDGCYTLFPPLDPPKSITIKTPIYCNPDYNTGGIEGGKAHVSWDAVSGIKVYVLERSINGGAFNEVYVGDSTSYTDSITNNINTVQYRVAAVDDSSKSQFTTSDVAVVQDNYPPFISGDDTALGDAATRIKYDYTVYDGDDVEVTVKEYVNTKLLRTYTAKGSQKNTLEIDLETWNGLSTGDNFIRIEVEDDNAATATQTKHFNKIGGVIDLTYVPYGATISTCPKAINVQLDLKMPLDATIQVLATNNGNDKQPVWDDITTAALSGHNHVFSNTAKEAGVDYYCVKLQVKINRNGADGDIKLYGIKCTLDCEV